MIIQTKEMPKEGQFVKMWVYEGRPWSAVYKWVAGVLYFYDSYQDDWVREEHEMEPYLTHSHLYFIDDGED